MRLTEFEPQRLNELSPATLASYKKKAGAAATAADAAGDIQTGNRRFSGIVKATKKQFDQDVKHHRTNEDDDPLQQKIDQMNQSLLDKMGKRFGLPPGSTAEQVQAAQQEYLDKNDPAAAAQYKQNMANIEAGGSHADNQPLQLAPTVPPGLNEFAPSGEGSGPYAYGMALKEMAKLYIDGEFDFADIGYSNTNENDAAEIDKVADAFLYRSAQDGREAYQMTNTELQDIMNRYLSNKGFDVENDIHAEYQKDLESYNTSSEEQPANNDINNVAEAALASMKRLAGIAPVATQVNPGQRQYRHMPTAVQSR